MRNLILIASLVNVQITDSEDPNYWLFHIPNSFGIKNHKQEIVSGAPARCIDIKLFFKMIPLVTVYYG